MQEEAEPDAAVLQRLPQNINLTMDDLRKESRAFHELVFTSNSDLGDLFELMSSLCLMTIC